MARTLEDDRRRTRFVGVVRWGFAAALVLVLAATLLSVDEIRRVRNEVRLLVETADRSTFLVGAIGRHLNRMRALALDHLLEPERDDAVERRELSDIDGALGAAMRELEPLLQSNEIAAWHEAQPQLAAFRAEVSAAVLHLDDARRDGVPPGLVTRIRQLAIGVETSLDELGRVNELESRLLLADADQRLARLAVAQGVLGVGLLLGIGAIGWMVVRVLVRQRRALDEHVARIETANDDLDAFAGRVAHDLRNVLSPLGTHAHALRQAAQRPEVATQIAARIDATVQRCRMLLDGLLAFSRSADTIGTGETASVRETLAAVIADLAPLAKRVDAAIQVEATDVVVPCPPELLHVVLANLIGNALKFLDGRPVRRVTVRVGQWDGLCELTVSDTGPGIPAEAQRRIFEPFYRVPGSAVPGTGIGLATVLRIVHACGGTISLQSHVERGAEFRVRVPACSRRTADEAAGVSIQ